MVLSNEDCTWNEPDWKAKKAAWLNALAKDHAKTVVILSSPKSERAAFELSPAVRQAIAQEIVACHQKLWKDCLPTEQLTLLQAARTGLMNSERPELKTLLARGLLRRDPELRLTNESFRRFVMAKAQPDTPPAEAAGESMANWHNMKGALWVLLTGVAAFLFLTQREVWNLVIGLATALMAGLNSLSQFSNLFKKDKAGKE